MIFKLLSRSVNIIAAAGAFLLSCVVNPAHVDFSSDSKDEPMAEDLYRIMSATDTKDSTLYALSSSYLYRITDDGSGPFAEKLMENRDYLLGLLRDKAGNLVATGYRGLYKFIGTANRFSFDTIYTFNYTRYADKYTIDRGDIRFIDFDVKGNLLVVCWNGKKMVIDTVSEIKYSNFSELSIASSGDTVFLSLWSLNEPISIFSRSGGKMLSFHTLPYDSVVLQSSFSLNGKLYLILDVTGEMGFSGKDGDDFTSVTNKTIIARVAGEKLLYVTDYGQFYTRFIKSAPDEGWLFSNYHIMKITPEKTVLKINLNFNALFLDNSGSVVMFYAPTLRLIKLEDLPEF